MNSFINSSFKGLGNWVPILISFSVILILTQIEGKSWFNVVLNCVSLLSIISSMSLGISSSSD